jgi:hypothetical protein
MANITRQGIVNSISGSTLYEALPEKPVRVVNMRFTCPNAYILKVVRYNFEGNDTSVLYELTLNAGDTVTDTFEYLLNPKDNIQATVNAPGVSFVISIVE